MCNIENEAVKLYHYANSICFKIKIINCPKGIGSVMKEYCIKEYHRNFNNLYDTLSASASKYPDKVAIIDDTGAYTYGELLERVDRMAWSLRFEYGMKKQEQIAFFMANSVHIVVAFYAAMKIGCIAVMLNTKFSPYEIEDYLNMVDAKLIISDSEWLYKFENIRIENRFRGIITENSRFGADGSCKMTADADKDDTAVIMHTSGTTSKPKGIMVTQGNILEAAYGYQETQELDSTAITVLSVPIFHILGLSCVTTMFIYIGGTVVLLRKYSTEETLKKIKEYKATHFHSVPAIYLDILHSDWQGRDLSSLRTTVCGGAPISDEDMAAFCRLAPNATFRKAYGMTETAGSGTLSHTHCGPLKAVPNVHMTVVDDKLNEVPRGTVGELVFCGPCSAKGRWGMESLTEPHIYSGDVGYMDDDDNVFIIDRKKDLINRGGEKIFPREVEDVILQYPGIEKAAVYAVSDARCGEVPYAAIILKSGETVDTEALGSYLKSRLAKYKRPVNIEIVEEFPVTQNGKVRKAKLREMAEERQKKV